MADFSPGKVIPGLWHRWRPLRFLAAGGVSTLCHWTVMFLLIQSGMTPLFATCFGSLCGALGNFYLQGCWAFSGASISGALPRYWIACAAGSLVNAAAFYFINGLVEISVIPAQAWTSLITALFNYFMYREYVFHYVAR